MSQYRERVGNQGDRLEEHTVEIPPPKTEGGIEVAATARETLPRGYCATLEDAGT